VTSSALRGFITSDNQFIRFIRFGIVGATTAAIYFVLYFGLRGLTSLGPAESSTIAYVAAIAFQYVAHARFTFGKRPADAGQATRFLVNVALGGVIAALIMEYGPGLLNVSEFVCGLLLIVVLAAYNWTMMRLWVYR
jgi:putative flippase GtrA